MKVHLLILSLSACVTIQSQSQNTVSFHRQELSLGPEYALPIGGFRSGNGLLDAPGAQYKSGLGGSAKYIYHINNTYGVSLQAGVIKYNASDKALGFTAVPVKLGGQVRYRSVFIEPQVGLTYFSGNRSVYQSGATTYGFNLGGYVSRHVVVSGNYERWNKGGFGASHIGVRLAYALFLESRQTVDSVRKVRQVRTYEINPNYRQTADWAKRKTFNRLGWVSLGIGLPVTFIGFVAAVASSEGTHYSPSLYNSLLISGGAITLSSIPLFVVAHKYKVRAQKPIP